MFLMSRNGTSKSILLREDFIFALRLQMASSMFLSKLKTKNEVDSAIKQTEDKVLVLRFGQVDDKSCMKIDDILFKTEQLLSKMAVIYLVNVNDVPVYTKYFDITYIPSTIFFFNGHHIQVDYGAPDQTKFIGSFKTKEDLIDLVEVIYRGAMQGKLCINSPIDPRNIPKYDLLLKDF